MMDRDQLTDKDLDALLTAAKQPALPAGFSERLQAKLQVETKSNVIAFPAQKHRIAPSRRIWLSAIPLAASLAFGIYVGTVGDIPESLSGLEGTLISDVTENLDSTGFEDTESFLNGDLS